MNDTTITAEEAQRRLEERRKELQATPAKPGGFIAAFAAAKDRYNNLTEEERQKLKEERKREEQEYEKKWQEEARRERIASLISNAHLPLRHSQVSVDHSKPKSAEWEAAYIKLKNAKKTGFLMGLTGTRGNGKTQLAVELCKSYCADYDSALFITAMEFFVDIKSTFHRDEERTEKEALQEYIRYKLLVIDEIGVRAETDWENQLLFELLNRRYNSKVDTLLIANHTHADFIRSIGSGLASRMNETGGIIDCNWESFRK